MKAGTGVLGNKDNWIIVFRHLSARKVKLINSKESCCKMTPKSHLTKAQHGASNAIAILNIEQNIFSAIRTAK